ncbi:Type I Iterative PKS [Apiospora aurea]|uniref:Type I Iterative PKS n=1 Tax=Apiospora aurea TaxID=335848 RepID=A0ABR1QXE3_9PEZI
MEPVAIIGFSFRLPQGTLDEERLWEVMQNRENLTSDWPADRLNIQSFCDDGNTKGRGLAARGGHFVKEDITGFDAPFFSVSSNEAAAMDPQHRWALEVAYQSFESAGLTMKDLKGSRTAVYATTISDDYNRIVSRDTDDLPRTGVTGIALSTLPARISWFFHLEGPSMHLDTACSGSMVALDLACQSMRNGDTDAALILASSMFMSPETSIMLGNMNFLSPHSRCYSFDHRANGYARGEGVLGLVIKPLSAAISHGDTIRAVIRATGSNQDGHTPTLTQPSVDSQERLIREVYRKAGLEYGSTRYFEAHGTGTPAGDPVEMEAIGRVFRTSRSEKEPLYVGSVKANVGHLEGGSGLAGIIKAVMILERGIIPPNALFERLNPAIDSKFCRTTVHGACDYLHEHGITGNHNCMCGRFGAVGGQPLPCLAASKQFVAEVATESERATGEETNEARLDNGTCQKNGSHVTNGSMSTHGHFLSNQSKTVESLKVTPRLLVWSGFDEATTKRVTSQYRDYLQILLNMPDQTTRLSNLAHTLHERRGHLMWRSFAVISGGPPSQEVADTIMTKPVRSLDDYGVAFVFTGQGAQYVGMGLGPLRYDEFRNTLKEIDGIFAVLGLCSGNIAQPDYSQPLCTALQIALVDLLETFNMTPTVVVGHSSGEIAAATPHPGAMLSVGLAEHNILDRARKVAASSAEWGDIHIACINRPHNTTVSGSASAIDKLKLKLDREGVFARKVNTGVAYHSPAMNDIAEEYATLIGPIESRGGADKDRVQMVSSVSGATISPKLLCTTQYWADNLTLPVRFNEAILCLSEVMKSGRPSGVNKNVVVPGAAMLVMAVQAAHQLATVDQELAGFLIKTARFLSPIIVSPSEGQVETVMQARPVRKAYEKEARWFDATIFSYSNGQRTQCFDSRIMLQFVDHLSNLEGQDEQILEHDRIRQRHRATVSACSQEIAPRAFYTFLKDFIGLDYGKSFQILEKIRWDSHDSATATVNLESTGLPMTGDFPQPTVLDAAIHLCLAQLSRGLAVSKATLVPHELSNTWISCRGWEGSSLELESTAKQHNEGASAEMTVNIISDSNTPLCSVGCLKLAPVARSSTHQPQDEFHLYTVNSRLQLSSLGAQELQGLCSAATHVEARYLGFERALSPSLVFYARKALSQVSEDDIQHGPPHMGKYVSSIKALLADRSPGPDRPESYHENLLQHRSLPGKWMHWNSYDLIVAGSVIHAVSDVAATLRILRRLLKDSGHLLLLETVAPQSPCVSIMWGLLPSWWIAKEDWRCTTPQLKEAQWGQVLQQTGFSGADVILSDQEDPGKRLCSIMISTAVANPSAALQNGTVQNLATIVVFNEQSDSQARLAHYVAESHGGGTLPLGAVEGKDAIKKNNIVIFLLDVGESFLSATPEEGFDKMKVVLQQAERILWVSSSNPQSPEYALHGLAKGFLRSLRGREGLGEVRRIRQQGVGIFLLRVPQAPEAEYCIRDGLFFVERVVQEADLERRVQASSIAQPRNEPWLSGSAKMPSSTEARSPADHVQIQARAWPLSFRDIFIALGRLEGESLGFECSGAVSRVGPNVTEFRPGDRVLCASPGCIKTYPSPHVDFVQKLPDGVSFEDAVSGVNPAMTAYYSLVIQARLAKGEKVLTHSGTGSTGQMAIWIAKHVGAEVFATVGSKEKRQLLVDHFGIPVDHIFHSRNTTFAAGVMRATGHCGVDVVLNSLSGDGLLASWECVAPYGRFVEIDKADISSNSALPMSGFKKNVSFFAVDLHHMALSNRTLVKDILSHVANLFAQKALRNPFPCHIFSIWDLEQALRYMQSGKHTGRIVMTADDRREGTKYIRTRTTTWTFAEDASYVVAGGFGGLGRSIIRWMASRGAKNFIVLSRSGPSSSGPVALLMQELEAQSVHVFAPQCDATSESSLRAVIEECERRMPPHQRLHQRSNGSSGRPQSLLRYTFPDFFILLSSLSGIYGSAGQSNYAAGCTYQDALARYRIGRGEKAVSLDVGWMRTIGIIAERDDYRQIREMTGDMVPIEEQDFLALLEVYCDPRYEASLDKAQLLIGARTPGEYLDRGHTQIETWEHPLFRGFRRRKAGGTGGADSATRGDGGATSGADDTHLFQRATSGQERSGVVMKALADKLARAVAIPPEDIRPAGSLSDYGVDSLVAVELRNWITNKFRAQVDVFDIMGGKSIQSIADLVSDRSAYSLQGQVAGGE